MNGFLESFRGRAWLTPRGEAAAGLNFLCRCKILEALGDVSTNSEWSCAQSGWRLDAQKLGRKRYLRMQNCARKSIISCPQPQLLIFPGWIVSQGGLRGRFAGRNVSQWWVAGGCGLWVDGAGLRIAMKCEPVWIGHLDKFN